MATGWTTSHIKSLKPKAAPYRVYEKVADRRGFGVQVLPSGARVFFIQHQQHGKRRFYTLGKFPDISLEQARARYMEERKRIAAGDYPATRAKATRAGTVNELFDEFIADMKTRDRRSVDEVKRSMLADVIPAIGDMQACDVQPRHIAEILHAVIKRGAPVQANRIRSYLRAMFQFAGHHDHDPRHLDRPVRFNVASNPVSVVPRQRDAERAGERVLTWDEIREIWNDDKLAAPWRLAIKLILVTGGQRPSEITQARWAEFDLQGKLWTLPGSRTKNRRDHLLPLTPMALEVLADIRQLNGDRGRFLFPAGGDPTASRPVAGTTISSALHRHLIREKRALWTPRDLRRTCKTLMGEIGIDKDTRDRLANHAAQDVSSVHYDRYSYLAEKSDALDRWCGKLRELVNAG